MQEIKILLHGYDWLLLLSEQWKGTLLFFLFWRSRGRSAIPREQTAKKSETTPLPYWGETSLPKWSRCPILPTNRGGSQKRN